MYREDMRPIIVESFIKEFNKNGPRLNLDDVASSIHMSKKTIYRFFRSKQSIYEYILNDASKQILLAQQAIFTDESLSTKEKLYRITTIQTTWEGKIDLSHMGEVQDLEPEVYNHVIEAYNTHWGLLLKLLENGIADGTLKPDTNPAFLVNLFQHGMTALYENGFLARAKLTYTEGICLLSKTIFDGAFAD